MNEWTTPMICTRKILILNKSEFGGEMVDKSTIRVDLGIIVVYNSFK